MKDVSIVKQKDARVKLCEILNAAYVMGFAGTLDFSDPAGVVSTLGAAGVSIRWDSGKNRFKARG